MACDKYKGGSFDKNSGCNICAGCSEEVRDLFSELALFKQYYKESKEKLDEIVGDENGYGNPDIAEDFLENSSDLIKKIETLEGR